MKKHFFTARNVEDYRNFFSAAVKTKIDADNEQFIFHAYIKNLFKVDDDVFDGKIVGETDFDGLRLDFNFGLRLDVPVGNFRVRISDADTEQIFFDHEISGGRLISAENYFIRWHIEVFRDSEKIFEHILDLSDQNVAFVFKFPEMGDTLAMLPFVREFVRRHNCRPTLILPEYLREFAANLYPELPQSDKIPDETYATYYMAMIRGSSPISTFDLRNMPMNLVGGAILGLKNLPQKPIFKPTMPRITPDPYVCIAVQASANRKGWLWPNGWEIVVDRLKKIGFRVFCIDKRAVETNDGITIAKPSNSEDFTGDLPILHRANMLHHAEFFIGLGSGLAWLADAVGCPVVMICGFSQDWFEFHTPHRVANRLVCNGCFNDVRVDFIKKICPYHFGTPRELECQRKISPQQILDAIGVGN